MVRWRRVSSPAVRRKPGAENYILNDLFVAIPAAATAPTVASFAASYQTGVLDFTGASGATVRNALFKLTANGAGGIADIALTGQAADQTANKLTQTVSGATYLLARDGAGRSTFRRPLA